MSNDTSYFPNIESHIETHSSNGEIYEELIKSGWNISNEKFGEVELFFEACATNDIEKVNLFLEFGFNIDKYGRDALMFTCSYSRFEVYERLISLGIKPDIGVGFCIIKCVNIDMLERILDDGFDVNCKDNNDKSLIHCAAETGSLEMVKLMVERDAKAITGMTISHFADN